MVKSVGIWLRVSTEDQVKGESPEHHEKRARLYAESKDWQIKEVYHLEAVSGKSVMNHPEAQRMLNDIRNGHITGIIFSKLARLARNTKELLEFADIFRESNADLISLQEAIDTSSPAGRLFYTMIAAMAQWEREEIAERVAASVPIRAKLGKPLGGQAPYGYKYEDKRLVPDPQEAPIRKFMYELFLEHRRKKTVARLLNQSGYRTRNGSKFSDTTVERLLRDPTAKGIKRANYTKSLGDNKQWILKPESEWVLTKVEPIVSEELWEQCNLLLDERKSGKRPSRRPVQLFAGLAYCVCGNKMYVPSNTPKYVCSKCHNKINVTDLEGVFQEQLKRFFLSSTEITEYLNQADKTIKDKELLLNALENEYQKLKQEMDKIMRLYLDDKITPDGFGDKYRPLEIRKKQLDDQIPKLQGETDFLKIQFLSSDQILNDARDLYSRWQDLTPEEKRKIAENIVETITIGKDDVTINLCYLPSSSEIMTGKQRNFTPALPFCQATLNAPKPLPVAYPRKLETIGDHLRKKRLDLGLLQKDVAEKIGVDESTIYNWEKGIFSPSIIYTPKIIEFLGYVPYDTTISQSIGEKILSCRRLRGMTQKGLARILQIDPGTLARMEKGLGKPLKETLEVIINYLSEIELIVVD